MSLSLSREKSLGAVYSKPPFCYHANMATIGRRIAQARHEKRWTQEQLARTIGRSTATIRKYEADAVVPPIDVLRGIADATGHHPEWFIQDRAPDHVPDLETVLHHTERQLRDIRDALAVREQSASIMLLAPDDWLELPLITGVPAGPWAEAVEHPEAMIAIPAILVPQRYRGQQVYVLRVRGDSMEGLGIYDGALVGAVVLPHYDLGHIVVARRAGEVTIKRLVASPEGDLYLLPESIRHEAIRVTDDVEIVGRVFGWWTAAE